MAIMLRTKKNGIPNICDECGNDIDAVIVGTTSGWRICKQCSDEKHLLTMTPEKIAADRKEIKEWLSKQDNSFHQ